MRVGYLIDKRENPKGVVPLGVFFLKKKIIKMILTIMIGSSYKYSHL